MILQHEPTLKHILGDHLVNQMKKDIIYVAFFKSKSASQKNEIIAFKVENSVWIQA